MAHDTFSTVHLTLCRIPKITPKIVLIDTQTRIHIDMHVSAGPACASLQAFFGRASQTYARLPRRSCISAEGLGKCVM